MYDFYHKTYVENECVIYLNETSQNIFKKENRGIQLSFILYSTMKNTEFKVNSNPLKGGSIEPYHGIIKNGKCEFNLLLKFNNNFIIENGDYFNIIIKLNIKTLEFKIRFKKPSDHIFSDDYYLHFGIKGKNDINENWNLLNKAIGEKIIILPF